MFSPLVGVPNLRVFDLNTTRLVLHLNILSQIGISCPKFNHIREFIVGPQIVSFVLNMIAYVLDNVTVLVLGSQPSFRVEVNLVVIIFS